ncbi:MAG: T9SS type A sorting domain-containing protein [Bacteroidota bacterium]
MAISWKYIFCAAALLTGSVAAATAQSIITTIAGDGITQYIGDGTPATVYSLAHPEGIYVDKNGTVFVADNYNHRVRKITATGTISTLAGNNTTGYSGDGGPATAAVLNKPNGIFADTAGNLYVTEWYNNVVRKISASTGIITTVCGNGGGGFSGDGGPATAAHFETPGGAVVDLAGNIYIPDYGNHRIRKVSAATGIINTVAGNGTNGYSGDGGVATNAALSYPLSLCLDSAGNIFVAEFGSNVIRRIDAGTGVISTVAGNGTNGYTGDNGPATTAQLGLPNSVFMDKKGILYISEYGNNVIRAVNTAGIISTIAGTGVYSYTGDGGPPLAATFHIPSAVFVDSAGTLYVADAGNSVIRKIMLPISGVNDMEATGNGVCIYPNPSNGKFILRYASKDEACVTIIDVRGQRIYGTTLRNGSNDIDVSGHAAGIYFVQVVSAGSVQVHKYIKAD